IFRRGHSAISDFEHVGIIPVSGAGEGFETDLLVEDVEHSIATTIAGLPFLFALPSVFDVARGTPEISYTVRPEPRFARAPFTNTEYDRPSGGIEGGAHDGVGRARVLSRGVAPVVF